MATTFRILTRSLFAIGLLYSFWVILPRSLRADVEAPFSLGSVVQQSSNIVLVTITSVDKEKNIILYRKVADLKGKHPTDVIKHNIGQNGPRPGEWKNIMNWAEVGKQAVFFHNGGASETCIGNYWYQAYPRGEWWDMNHPEPYMLRTFCGRVEQLSAAITQMIEGKEVIHPCMENGPFEDIRVRKLRIQRVKASLKLLDYNPKRDFVGWGGEDIRRLSGMPGFSQFAGLSRIDSEGQSVTPIDLDGDRKIDLCLCSSSRVALFLNQGDAYSEVSLPGLTTGARSAVWGDYNQDGKPDLVLATPQGLKLYTNSGAGQFRDDTPILPAEPFHHVTAAGWLDADGDGKLDLVFSNGFHGMRLYHNKLTPETIAKMVPPKMGDWHYIGPFPNSNNQGFDVVYPPEKEIDFAKQYEGKGEKAIWKKGTFTDGSPNNLALFQGPNNSDAVVYIYREIDCSTPTDLPVSLGSDDTLTVWLNGEKLISENSYRALATDQHKINLKLKAGKNRLLMKIGQGGGEWAFYCQFGQPIMAAMLAFEPVPTFPQGESLVETLAVTDFNNDGRPDLFLGGSSPVIWLNTGTGVGTANAVRFVLSTTFADLPAKAIPLVIDFNQDGLPDLLLTHKNGCQLRQNLGNGNWTDFTAKAGDLARPIPGATTATRGDFNNDGHVDLMIGCLRGINRYLENTGNGSFVDRSAEIGFTQRIFNTQSLALADLNGDGRLDLILNNEGQDSAILFGNPEIASKKTATTIFLPKGAFTFLSVTQGDNRLIQTIPLTGGENRGSQSTTHPRFVADPGTYRLNLRDSTGKFVSKTITIGTAPNRQVWDEEANPAVKK